MCGKTSFQKIEIIDRDNCSSSGGWCNDTTLQIRGQIEEFPEGEGVSGGYVNNRSKSLWNPVSKACLSCGYIVSFLPFEQLRKNLKLKSEAKAKKKVEAIKRKEAKKKATAAAKKAAIEAEKESLKKRLSELEDLD